MKGKKLRLLSVALCLLPTLAGVLLWDALPVRIATHFDFSGTADGWASKGYAVFFLPAMLAVGIPIIASYRYYRIREK